MVKDLGCSLFNDMDQVIFMPDVCFDKERILLYYVTQMTHHRVSKSLIRASWSMSFRCALSL